MSQRVLDSCSSCGNPLLDGKCARCLLNYALDYQGDELESLEAWRFGDYEILGKIARGGMGVVYRARQLSLNRPVALKMIIGGELASKEAVRRFRIEAEAAAQLRHPNIVPIYDVGEVEHEHYFAMELIEGGSLSTQGPWDPKAAAALIAKVARALAYAHEHGVLHRDLKPSNILLDEMGEPRLADFGLAKLVSQDHGLTLSQEMLGSPGYVAPEQAAQGDITTAADIYGLGAVLYELLAGRPPFVGNTALQTLRRVMDEAPTPLPRTVPRDLATICLKCLEKVPSARYASARNLAEDCERFLRGELIRARPVSQAEVLWRWVKRRPAPAALAATTLLTMVVGVSGVFWQWRRAQVANTGLQKSITQLEWRRTVQSLNQDDRSPGLAQLAWMLRRDPNNPRTTSLALSALEQSHLATPASPSIVHGRNIVILQARLGPDARRIVTAGADGTARLWDAASSQPLGKVMQHQGVVRWVEFSADGERLATVSDDKTARLWNAHTGEPLSEPLLHDGPVLMAKFAREKLVTISADGNARLWPEGKKFPLGGAGRWLEVSADGTHLFTCSAVGIKGWTLEGAELFNTPASVKGISLSPDGGRLAGWANDGMSVWDTAHGIENPVNFEGAAVLNHAAWSPDGKTLSGAANGSWARIWNADTGEPVTSKLPHVYGCEFVVFSPDGRTLMSGGDDGKARIWNSATGAPVFTPLNHNDGVLWAEYSHDGRYLLTTSRPWGVTMTHGMGEVQLWDMRQHGTTPWRFDATAPGGMASAGVAWSTDGRLCATCAGNGDVFVHEIATGRTVNGPWKNEGWSRAIAFLPGDRSVALVTGKGELSVWSMDSNARTLGPLHMGSIETGRFSHDGMKLLIGATDGEVTLWDLHNGMVICRPPRHIAPLNGLAFSPDDRVIATAGEDGQCFVSDSETGRLLFPVVRHDNEIVSVQFSPDGKWIVTASHDRSARMWDARTGEPHGEPMLHRGEVAYAEFNHRGTVILTACRDGTARLWDAKTGGALIEPMMHSSALRGASFSRDDRRIVTEDHDGLRLWEASTGEPLSILQPHPTSRGIGYNAQGLHAAFSPDGQSVLHGTASKDAIVWHFPEPPTPAPAWLPEVLEAVAATRITASNGLESVPSQRWIELRNKLRALPGEDFYARWARAFCAEAR